MGMTSWRAGRRWFCLITVNPSGEKVVISSSAVAGLQAGLEPGVCSVCGRRERADAEIRLSCAFSVYFLAFVNSLLAGPASPLAMETVGTSLLRVASLQEATASQGSRAARGGVRAGN